MKVYVPWMCPWCGKSHELRKAERVMLTDKEAERGRAVRQCICTGCHKTIKVTFSITVLVHVGQEKLVRHKR